jgi:hypothetical protein
LRKKDIDVCYTRIFERSARMSVPRSVVAAAVLAFAALLPVAPGYAAQASDFDPCSLAQLTGSPAHRSADPVLVAAAKRANSLVQEWFTAAACEADGPAAYPPFTIVRPIPGNEAHLAFILMIASPKTARVYSKETLVVLYLHEAAHHELARKAACQACLHGKPPLPVRLDCERQVDALVAEWMQSNRAVITMLREVRKAAGPYHSPGERADFEQEMDARIISLLGGKEV